MRWTERQRAMLREMGIPPFWPTEEPVAQPPSPVATTAALAPTSAPSPEPAGLRRMAAVVDEAIPQVISELQATTAGAGRPSPRATTATTSPSPVSSAGAKPIEVTLGPRPAGIETMDWPALREAVAGCQACGLCQSRTQPVFGVGNEHAQWMLVGEAPGEQEDKQGRPFVGRAGQLLDRMLAAVDLTRAEDEASRQVFIANVLKCRPPANRNPQPQEVAQCEPYLLRQVALVQPKVIVAMGRFAVQSLLKSTEAIGRLRGRVHDLAGVPLIVTYHPAYLLRNPADKALAWEDLCLAREVMRQRSA